MIGIDFNSQFSWNLETWLKGLDFPTWHRYLPLIKEIVHRDPGDPKPENVLEIGVGSRVVEKVLRGVVKNYITIDVNPELKPDIVGDLRTFNPELSDKFDYVICADVLEHMPFEDLRSCLENIFNYLIKPKSNGDKGGEALITIPHQRKEIVIVSRFNRYNTLLISLPVWITPRGFYHWFIKRNVSIDPYHCWEIGNRKVKREAVENVIRAAGFEIRSFRRLPYVDFWILKT